MLRTVLGAKIATASGDEGLTNSGEGSAGAWLAAKYKTVHAWFMPQAK